MSSVDPSPHGRHRARHAEAAPDPYADDPSGDAWWRDDTRHGDAGWRDDTRHGDAGWRDDTRHDDAGWRDDTRHDDAGWRGRSAGTEWRHDDVPDDEWLFAAGEHDAPPGGGPRRGRAARSARDRPAESRRDHTRARRDSGAGERHGARSAGPYADPVTDGRERPTAPAPPASRAGRNLPAAIGVGLTLGTAVIASLVLWRPAFLAVAVVAIGVATWEMTRAVHANGARPPLTPLLVGAVVMPVLAWHTGPAGLAIGLLLTVLATLVWRLSDGPAGYHRDATAATLIAVYVPFLGSFAVLLSAADDGAVRVLTMLIAVVLADTGGYVAGVFFGKRPLAPSVSPKKSWEGLAGGLLASAAGSTITLAGWLHAGWWWGIVFGVGVALAAVLGDLAESLLKRDLGIKDMSRLLPGHGGLMDRLDSILFAAPVAYLLLSVLAPR